MIKNSIKKWLSLCMISITVALFTLSCSSNNDTDNSTVIGIAGEFLGHNNIPNDMKDEVSSLDLGSDIAPIVAKSFYEISYRADACIQNAGAVRIAINEGNITIGTVYELLPFIDTLIEIDMLGSEIKQVLEDALSNYIDDNGSTGSFPYAYGLKYDIDSTATTNSRISNLEIQDKLTASWSIIDNDKIYVIVTNNYIAEGHDGYVTFANVQKERGLGVDTYLDYTVSFIEYIKDKQQRGETIDKLPAADHCIKSYKI